MSGMYSEANPSFAHGLQSTDGTARQWHQLPMFNPYGWVPFVSANIPHRQQQQQQQAMYGNAQAMAWQPMMHPALHANGYAAGNNAGVVNGGVMGGGAGANYAEYHLNGYANHHPTHSPSPLSAFSPPDVYDGNYHNAVLPCDVQDPFRYQVGQPRRTPYTTRWWDFVQAEFKWVDSPVGINLDVDQDDQDWPYDDMDTSQIQQQEQEERQPTHDSSPLPTLDGNTDRQVNLDAVHGTTQPAWNKTATTAPAPAAEPRGGTTETMPFALNEQPQRSTWIAPQPHPPPRDTAHRISHARHAHRESEVNQTRQAQRRVPRSSLFNPIDDDDEEEVEDEEEDVENDEQNSMEPTLAIDEDPVGGAAWHKRRRTSTSSNSDSSGASRSSTSSGGSGGSRHSSRTTSMSESDSDSANTETRSSDETETGEVSTQGAGITMQDISVMRPSHMSSIPAARRTTTAMMTMPSIPYSVAMPEAEMSSVFRPTATRDVPHTSAKSHPLRRSSIDTPGKRYSVWQDGQPRHSTARPSPSHTHLSTKEGENDDGDEEGAGANDSDKANAAAEYDVFDPDDEIAGGGAGHSSSEGSDSRRSRGSTTSGGSNSSNEENEAWEGSESDEEDGRRDNATSTSSQYMLDFTMQEVSVTEGLHQRRDGQLPPHQGSIIPHSNPKPVPRLPVPRPSTIPPTSSMELDRSAVAADAMITASRTAKKANEAHGSRRRVSGSGVAPQNRASLAAEADAALRTRREYSIVPMIDDKYDGAANDDDDRRHTGRDGAGKVGAQSSEASSSTSPAANTIQSMSSEMTPWGDAARFHRSSPKHDSHRRLNTDTVNAPSAGVEMQSSDREQRRATSGPDKANTAPHDGAVVDSVGVQSVAVKLPSIAPRLSAGTTRLGAGVTRPTAAKSGVATLPPTLTPRAPSGHDRLGSAAARGDAHDARSDTIPPSTQTRGASQDTTTKGHRTAVERVGTNDGVGTGQKQSPVEVKQGIKESSTTSSSAPQDTASGSTRRASTRIGPPVRPKAMPTTVSLRQSVSSETTSRRSETKGRTPASSTTSSSAAKAQAMSLSQQTLPQSVPPSVPQQLEIERQDARATNTDSNRYREITAATDHKSITGNQSDTPLPTEKLKASRNELAYTSRQSSEGKMFVSSPTVTPTSDVKQNRAKGNKRDSAADARGSQTQTHQTSVLARSEMHEQYNGDGHGQKGPTKDSTTKGHSTSVITHDKKLQLRAKRATPTQNTTIVQYNNQTKEDVYNTLSNQTDIKRRTSKRQLRPEDVRPKQ